MNMSSMSLDVYGQVGGEQGKQPLFRGTNSTLQTLLSTFNLHVSSIGSGSYFQASLTDNLLQQLQQCNGIPTHAQMPYKVATK